MNSLNFFSQWKAGPSSIYSISVCSSGNHLLSASKKIRLWDLETHTCLKVRGITNY